uniref:Uncharacterized protein n=1 Tax=Oryza brachyantha TaxID=4533 RepID=J3ML96_ORYBR
MAIVWEDLMVDVVSSTPPPQQRTMNSTIHPMFFLTMAVCKYIKGEQTPCVSSLLKTTQQTSVRPFIPSS